jgi:hypothetical protein
VFDNPGLPKPDPQIAPSVAYAQVATAIEGLAEPLRRLVPVLAALQRELAEQRAFREAELRVKRTSPPRRPRPPGASVPL